MLNKSWKLITKPKPLERHTGAYFKKYNLLLFKLSPLYKFTISDSKLLWNLLNKNLVRNVGWLAQEQFTRFHIQPVRSELYSNSRFIEEKMVLDKDPKLTLLNTRTLQTLFATWWELSRSKNNQNFFIHGEFRNFFVSTNSRSSLDTLISAKNYYLRWLNSYNFLFNIFHASANIQMFSNKIFIEESLVFNWHFSSKNLKIFKYTQPLFLFKDILHGDETHSQLLNFFSQRTDLALVTDLNAHKRFLFYLKRNDIYTVGLVPANFSPWCVSHPIPVFSDSHVMQYYFIKFLFYIKAKAQNTTYLTTNDHWRRN